jgi:tRNA 2-thiouridine synthesizing protein A
MVAGSIPAPPTIYLISTASSRDCMTSTPDKEIDCIGLYCPEPIFRTRTALDELEKGQILKVTADDPAAEEDLKRLSKRLGHEVVEITHDGDEVTLYIKK